MNDILDAAEKLKAAVDAGEEAREKCGKTPEHMFSKRVDEIWYGDAGFA